MLSGCVCPNTILGNRYDESLIDPHGRHIAFVNQRLHPPLDRQDATVEHLGCVQVGIGRDGRPRLWAGEVAAELEILVEPEGHAHPVNMLAPDQSIPDASEQLDVGVIVRAVRPRGAGWTG